MALERHRINNTNMKELLQTDSLILKELRKFYGGFLAVDRISLGNYHKEHGIMRLNSLLSVQLLSGEGVPQIGPEDTPSSCMGLGLPLSGRDRVQLF